MTGLALRSTAFADHGEIPQRFSRADGNVSPPLEWSGVPDTAEELLLLCEDPDAPGGPFLHWLVTGIDPTVTAAPELLLRIWMRNPVAALFSIEK